jgi:multimeric flavodoxin WrbA
MKIAVITGSRNRAGQTAQAVDAVVEGAIAAGAELVGDIVFLPAKKIERCRQCNDMGWGRCRKEGHCTINDDFSAVVAAIKMADAVLFATPVYYGDLSESMRAFLDRLRRTCTQEDGKAGISDKPAIGVCVAGGSGNGGPSCSASLEKVLHTCGFFMTDMVMVRRQNLNIKLDILRLTGKMLCEAGLQASEGQPA